MAASGKLLELAQHLKQERLFVSAEKDSLQRIHKEVINAAERLYHASWIVKQQRANVESLILSSHSQHGTPAEYCHKANSLDNVKFIDGYKVLGYQDTLYGDFMKALRECPQLVAQTLVCGEKLSLETTQGIIQVIVSAIYGGCIMPEDEHFVLQILHSLIELQLATNNDPRRLLRRGSCAFSTVFKLFSESVYTAKLFLTAALHEPIMSCLAEDDYFLETNVDAALERFAPAEIKRRFGDRGTPQFKQKLQDHMEQLSSQLVSLCNKFITSIKANMYCFPQSLCWIVSQLHKHMNRVGTVEEGDIRAMCADLLLSSFICPAIMNPEPYGIIWDVPISEAARFNLMQIAQILQVLTLSAPENADSKMQPLYSRFDNGCMSTFLDAVVDRSCDDTPPPAPSQLAGLGRSAVLITETELYCLVSFLRDLKAAGGEPLDTKQLDSILSNVPISTPPSTGPTVGSGSANVTPTPTPVTSPPNTPMSAKKNILGKVKGVKARLPGTNANESSEADGTGSPSEVVMTPPPEEVLIISLSNASNECPGMLPESKVLGSTVHHVTIAGGDAYDDGGKDEDRQSDKLTGISISAHNSDVMEATSEGGPSTRNSVYSLESDHGPEPMGRDPNERNALDFLEKEQRTTKDNIDEKLRKFEIIRDMGMATTEERDPCETYSTFSETWSTDVLPSDASEPPPEGNPLERLQEISGAGAEGGTSHLDSLPENLLEVDISETNSETWSVDVLASDSEPPEQKMEERLCEVEVGLSEEGKSSERGRSWWKKKVAIFKGPRGSRKKVSESDRDEQSSSPSPGFIPTVDETTEPQVTSDDILNKYRTMNKDMSAGDSETTQTDHTPDTTEDILEKYRALPSEESFSISSSPHDNIDDLSSKRSSMGEDQMVPTTPTDTPMETSYSFQDAKRKLRLVLGAADFSTLPWLANFVYIRANRMSFIADVYCCGDGTIMKENELTAFLKAQLSEAINLQDKSLIAQLHETLRCVQEFDDTGCKKLLTSLLSDYRSRAPYISYLVRCRQGLLFTQAHLERLLDRIEKDRMVCHKYFTSVCVRLFLQQKEEDIQAFHRRFCELTASDEKTDLVEEFLHQLGVAMSHDAMWQVANPTQLEDGNLAVERSIMSRIYTHALYPNGDGDIMRDQLFYDHILRLQKVVTASHKALQVPEMYRREAPWPSAQKEILTINAYKTPNDKLRVVVRCSNIIMNLLKMANENSVPGADDFTPVLVYVLLMANPPSLLSTIQYVNSFYGSRLGGEESYWWMQFSAAVEFIKTIDDRK
ncbi:GAPVD1 [Branchiostoma lanceolatum]|uniref:GAPVD1 protein n=1 Tax=Branchiostoma lanceolatum TaxID=7740 RepID=A0A8K0F1W2_BRALA|nr:GAPVD1 [Branchiostoma lanceolatum]